MRYRNTITGLIFEAKSAISSKHIEVLDDSRSLDIKADEKPEEKPKRKATKKGAKK